MIGLGKLGMPVGQAIASKGHDVIGYDIADIELSSGIKHSSITDIVRQSDLIFASPQTPHDQKYEGVTRLPDERVDFDYSYLQTCVDQIAKEAASQERKINLVIISTCLPGTFERDIKPLLNEYVNYIYQPLFIAMGTVKEDFLNPEFVLMGGQDISPLEDFYKSIHKKPLVKTDIITAEGIKVSYNTWITAKTVIANTWGEIAHKTGMDFDAIHKAWSLATDRIISPRYMDSGMGDGGGCHPRDNIAMSYFAKLIGLSHDIFEDLMIAREAHTEWIAALAEQTAWKHNLPLVILGRSFKPETDIETGSPSILLANILDEENVEYSHEEDIYNPPRAVYLIGTKHDRYKRYDFLRGSVVIDPFRYMPEKEGVEIIAIGKGWHE